MAGTIIHDMERVMTTTETTDSGTRASGSTAAVQRVARQGAIPAHSLPDGKLALSPAELIERPCAQPRSGGPGPRTPYPTRRTA